MTLTIQIQKNKPDVDFTFIDLFAGIGGIRLGFESVGGKCVFSSEWDRFCQKTYYDNFGVTPQGDISKIEAKDIPDHDILAAGFPCQPFSLAGKKLGFDDTRGTLFFDIARIVKEKRPKAFLLENVKNLRSHDKGNTWRVIMEALEELDYQVFSSVLDGQAYVPQHRERVLIIGFDRKRYRKNIDFSFDLEKPDNPPKLKDILEPVVDNKYTLSDNLWQYLQQYAAKQKAKGNGFGYGLADLDGITRTLSARYYKDGSEILLPQEDKNPRRLTPRECARLMGFDDSFIISVSDMRAYKQFGNSVVVPLIGAAAKQIVKTIHALDKKQLCTE